MDNQKAIWDELHDRYKDTAWINKPTIFASQVVEYFPKDAKVLELGVGQGQDARFFCEKGFLVTGVDISEKGLRLAHEKFPPKLRERLKLVEHNLSDILPFPSGSFDVVYSHLALHYFGEATTKSIFNEIYRVLRIGGVLAALFNSTSDPEFGSGEKIEIDYYLIRGVRKHFFSEATLKNYINAFEVTLLDDEGETYKDRAIGTSGLIRLIARKVA